MKRWLGEPLLHFLIAGGVLFAAYGGFNREGGDERRVVQLTTAEVNWLTETWLRQRLRPPSEAELRGMVTDYLKESLLAREARDLGLDANDTVVRRRLAQKMEFMVQDTARLVEPGEDELRGLYDKQRVRYRTPARISFTQHHFKSEAAARTALLKLGARDAADHGGSGLLERDYTQADGQAVAAVFGPAFADQVFALPAGQWAGPLASGYGFHLVRVSERLSARERPFEEVRAQILDEWHGLQQARASEQFFEKLLKKYDVVVEDRLKPLVGPLPGGV